MGSRVSHYDKRPNKKLKASLLYLKYLPRPLRINKVNVVLEEKDKFEPSHSHRVFHVLVVVAATRITNNIICIPFSNTHNKKKEKNTGKMGPIVMYPAGCSYPNL